MRYPNTAHQHLLDESRKVGWPEYWQGDLDIDLNQLLGEDMPEQFGWILRRLGTHIILPGDQIRVYEIDNAFSGVHRFYYYDGKKLIEMTSHQLVDRLRMD